jgi:hypothetical protein
VGRSKPCNDDITMFIAIRYDLRRIKCDRTVPGKSTLIPTSNQSLSLTRASTNDANIVVCSAPLQYLLLLVGEKLQANYIYGKVGRSGES